VPTLQHFTYWKLLGQA